MTDASHPIPYSTQAVITSWLSFQLSLLVFSLIVSLVVSLVVLQMKMILIKN